jgi:hypothetical protein
MGHLGHYLNAHREDSRLGASSKAVTGMAPRPVPYEVGLSRERVLRHLEPEHLISPVRGTFRSRRRNGRHAPAPLEYSRVRGVAIELAAGIYRAGAERRVYGGRTRLRSLGSAALVRCLALFLDDQETLGRDAGQRPTSALGVHSPIARYVSLRRFPADQRVLRSYGSGRGSDTCTSR